MFPSNRLVIFTLAMTLANGQLISFNDGKVGVNFAGYHASAGLGGLLTGDLSKGGLHAEAGTPFGQSARAGLAGAVGNGGGAAGGLYAGATAGGGVSAAAGLEGAADGHGAVGSSAAGAVAGGVGSAVEKTSVNGVHSGLYVEKSYIPQPVVVQKTYVAPAPVSVEKTVYRPHKKYAHVQFESNINTVTHKPEVVKVVETTYVKPVPAPVTVHKYVSTGGMEGGFLSRLFAGLNTGASVGGSAGGEVHSVAPAKRTQVVTSTNVHSDGGLFTDIFNIPISTLHAVNRLVSNIAGGVSVTKTAHVY